MGKVLILEIILGMALVVAKKEDKKNQWKKKQQSMQLDYPEIVSKMLTLCGSGMSIKQAWNKISASYQNKREKFKAAERPAYEEFVLTSREMLDGISERVAIQNFGERTGLRCYHRFSRLLVENMQKGSKGMNEQLQREAEEAFEERKRMAKKLGEEAGTKMLFPMILMLVIVMAIIMVPAGMSM